MERIPPNLDTVNEKLQSAMIKVSCQEMKQFPEITECYDQG